MSTTPDAPQPRAERVSHALVRDVALPGGAGTLALVTIDNGLDHTKPTTLGPLGIAELTAALTTVRERVRAGEVQALHTVEEDDEDTAVRHGFSIRPPRRGSNDEFPTFSAIPPLVSRLPLFCRQIDLSTFLKRARDRAPRGPAGSGTDQAVWCRAWKAA